MVYEEFLKDYEILKKDVERLDKEVSHYEKEIDYLKGELTTLIETKFKENGDKNADKFDSLVEGSVNLEKEVILTKERLEKELVLTKERLNTSMVMVEKIDSKLDRNNEESEKRMWGVIAGVGMGAFAFLFFK